MPDVGEEIMNNGDQAPLVVNGVTVFQDTGQYQVEGQAEATSWPEPSEWRGDEGPGGGEVAVSTEVMRSFADWVLHELFAPVNLYAQVLDGLGPVNAGAPAFTEAANLAKDITGGGGADGLQQNYRKVLGALQEALFDTSEGLIRMAYGYETSEAFNAATGQDLADAMPELGAKIQAVTSALGTAS